MATTTTANNKDWTDYIGGKPSADSRTISVRIPNDLLSSLTLSTTNEDIQISSLNTTDAISILNNSGNIIFDEVSVGNALLLTAKNGDIRGTIAGNSVDFSIERSIKKGKSDLSSVDNHGGTILKASNNNGDVEIGFAMK